MSKNKKRRGFTIVELVIVIAVIAVLAAVLIPTFSGLIEKAKNSAATQKALGAYTEYIINHAQEGNILEYAFYKTDGKTVVIKNGQAFAVCETEEEAVKTAFDNPETEENEAEGMTLNSTSVNGMYFMQGAAETECAHSYTSVITPPQCTAEGYTTHTCSLCGDSYTDSETAATGEHNYVDGKCVCGEEEPEQKPEFIAMIGNAEKEGGLFELTVTSEPGVYKVTVERCNSYSPADNLHFIYYMEQLLKYDVPEIAKHIKSSTKGFKLEQSLGSDLQGKIQPSRSSGEERLQLPEDKCTLILNFNAMTWYIDEDE